MSNPHHMTTLHADPARDRAGARPPRTSPAARPAFTLTELLVAIGIVALLTLGIGQLFSSTQRLVNAGAATAEIDQLARAIEQQLRDDFDALNRMPTDETFIAIRMREIGDVDRDGMVDSNEAALYLSPDDRDFDLQNRLAPYEQSPNGRLRSRAVTRRIDEIMFIAPPPTGTQHYSVQTNSDKKRDERDAAERLRSSDPPGARHARIYYGHALRPYPDPEWPPDDFGEPGAQRSPRRFFYPDGDFGQGPNQLTQGQRDNRYAAELMPSEPLSSDLATGLNEHAGDWIFTRQSTLLFGGLAAGFPQRARRVSEAPIGRGREYAMFIRDNEAIDRAPGVADLGYDLLEVVVDYDANGDADLIENVYDEEFPEPRLSIWGRTDICAQDRDDVQRWLEGEAPGYMPGQPTTALPFRQGRFSDPEASEGDAIAGDNPGEVNRFLWQRISQATPGAPTAPAERQRLNRQRLQSAIAGAFFRPQQTSEAVVIDRSPEEAEIQPDDVMMDVHAVLTSNCSNFEIAWSDGARAPFDANLDGDVTNGPEVRQDDLLWYDITPVDPTESEPERRTLRWWIEDSPFAGEPGVFSFASPPDTNASSADDRVWPEIDFQARDAETNISGGRWGGSLPVTQGTTFAPITSSTGVEARYNAEITGGAPLLGGDAPSEYLAIWPFRVPDAEGEYAEPFPKDLFIRIRVTLHDSQLRAEKEFEFIFRVQPRRV